MDNLPKNEAELADESDVDNREYALDLINEERNRQDGMWGNDFDDKNTPNDWISYICRYASQSGYGGILDVEKFEQSMIKAGALCVAAIEALHRNRMTMPKRHYD